MHRLERFGSRLLLVIAAFFGALASSPTALAAGAPSWSLSRVATQLPAGQVWGVIAGYPLCAARERFRSNGSIEDENVSEYAPSFAQAFTGVGAGSSQGAPNLFEDTRNRNAADYQVGGLIHGLSVKICSSELATSTTAEMAIQWQVYSTGAGKVVATVETTARLKSLSYIADPKEAVRRVFAENAKQLAASPEIAALRSQTSAPASNGQPASPDFERIQIAGSSANRPLPEAVGAVVLVSLGDAFGSGVLVSRDGLILTNEHVVGRAKQVRIRWSDGFEAVGEVIRTHAGRDVALIRTDPRGRDPLPLRTRPLQTGETVFAIGAPLEKELQGTVTRGIVSAASRVRDGFTFIQSDVTVNHGNSGGPLVDENGQVVALTDLGLNSNGAPLGLNFFVPIKDALDFLRLDLAPAQVSVTPSGASLSSNR